jgi:hypothetical protein
MDKEQREINITVCAVTSPLRFKDKTGDGYVVLAFIYT